MARPKTTSPKLFLHRASGFWCVTLDGKRHYLSKIHTEALDLHRVAVGNWLLGEKAPPERRTIPHHSALSPTVASALAAYLDHVGPHLSAGQFWRVSIACEEAMAAFGSAATSAFDQLALQEVRSRLLARDCKAPAGGGCVGRLYELLADGPVRSLDVLRTLGAEGWSKSAVREARMRLGATTKKGRMPDGGWTNGGWTMTPPPGMVAPKAKAKKLSRTYVNALVGIIQSAWTWCVSQKLAPDGSDMALRSVRPLRRGRGGREVPPVLPPPPGSVEATLAHLRPDLAIMVQVEALTGMRPGEICLLRPCDISTAPDRPVEVPLGDGRFVAVCAIKVGAVVVWAFAPQTSKMLYKGKTRVVPIGPEAQALLAPLLAGADPQAYLFRPLARRGRPRSNRWTTASYRQAVQKAARKAGVEAFGPNRLRHQAATLGANAGDVHQTAAMLGHGSATTTQAHYVATTFAKGAELAAKAG